MRNVQISLIGSGSEGARIALKVPPPVDHVVVLHGPDARSVRAAGDVRATAEMLPGTSCDLREVDPFDMIDILTRIIEVRKEIGSVGEAKVTIVASDATNIMAGAATLGCLLIDAEAFYVKERLGTGRNQRLEERIVRFPLPKIHPQNLSRPLREVLGSLPWETSGVIDKAPSYLRNKLGLPPQTASYRLKRLAILNLVEYSPEGRNRRASLTGPGRLFAALFSATPCDGDGIGGSGPVSCTTQ